MNIKQSNSGKKELSLEDFLEAPRVLKCLKELEDFQQKTPLIVSDVLDKDGHQYVNLVQKGGGVLGVALVGYTYVLEKVGIRFLRLDDCYRSQRRCKERKDIKDHLRP